MTITCFDTNTTIITTARPTGRQFVVHFQCGCDVSAGEFQVPLISLDCDYDRNLNVSVQAGYLINLPILTEFFNETELDIFSAESVLNTSVPVNLPPLAIANQEYNDALLLDEEASYDLQSLINQTKRQSTMYSSLAQYLYHTLIKANQYNKDFDVFNTLDWLVLIATVAGFLALICSGILYYKVRTIMAILTASHFRSAMAEEVGLHYTLSTTTTSSLDHYDKFLQYQKVLLEVLPVDLTLLLLLILLILVLVAYLVWKYLNSRRASTILELELGDGQRSLTWSLAKLTFPAQNYKIEVDVKALNLRPTEFLFSAVIDWNVSQAVSCSNTLLNMPQNIGDRVYVPFWRLPTLRKILKHEFYSVIHIKAKNDDVLDSVLLHSYGRRAAGLFQLSSMAYNVEHASLYPMVSP